MQRLDCHVKNYAWGKNGNDSEVANLFAAGHAEHIINSKTPYAELWMGTHPDGPARVRDSSENLSRLIAKSDRINNNDKQQRNEVHLPFIMKIMSIKHTLSLQVHPTKEQASWLHNKDPINYPDRHHKPELAYALTRFELLCGFRPAKEIVKNMNSFPELKKIMGEEASNNFELLVNKGVDQNSKELKNALRICFSNMLYKQKDTQLVNELLNSFYKKLSSGIRGCLIDDTIPVLESMKKYFPNDVGCFSPLYLNHMILQPGECCFYAAEELHAYLSGECVECVGCSNNTIRAALTPKFVDKEALIEVLNYRMTEPDYYLVLPKQLKNYSNVLEYAPDCKDFTLHHIEIKNDNEATSSKKISVDIPSLQCASIMIIVEGEAECLGPNKINIKRGDIYYIPPENEIKFILLKSKRLLAYRTFSYEIGPDHSNRKQLQQISNDILPIRTKSVIVPDLNKLKEKILSERPKFGLENDAELFDLDTDMDGLC